MSRGDGTSRGGMTGPPDSGTFVKWSLDAAPEQRIGLQAELATWVREARRTGLDDEGIVAPMAGSKRTKSGRVRDERHAGEKEKA